MAELERMNELLLQEMVHVRQWSESRMQLSIREHADEMRRLRDRCVRLSVELAEARTELIHRDGQLRRAGA